MIQLLWMTSTCCVLQQTCACCIDVEQARSVIRRWVENCQRRRDSQMGCESASNGPAFVPVEAMPARAHHGIAPGTALDDDVAVGAGFGVGSDPRRERLLWTTRSTTHRHSQHSNCLIYDNTTVKLYYTCIKGLTHPCPPNPCNHSNPQRSRRNRIRGVQGADWNTMQRFQRPLSGSAHANRLTSLNVPRRST